VRKDEEYGAERSSTLILKSPEIRSSEGDEAITETRLENSSRKEAIELAGER